MLASKLTFLALIIYYLYLGNTPDIETLFYILTIFQQMANSFSLNIPSNLSYAAQLQASIQRINYVLQSDDDCDRRGIESNQNQIDGVVFVSISNVTIKIMQEIVLRDICLDLKKQSLIFVTGAVGSGKSSLLKLLLKDYYPSEGNFLSKLFFSFTFLN